MTSVRYLQKKRNPKLSHFLNQIIRLAAFLGFEQLSIAWRVWSCIASRK